MSAVLQAPALRPVTRTLTRCLVCGSNEVRSDEVVDRGLVLLHECPRCEHRWTLQPLAAVPRAPLRPARRAAREVASAA